MCSTSRLYTSIVFLQQVFFIFTYPFPNVAAFMGNEDVKMDEGVTKLDRIRNERIRGIGKVGEISKKVQESRLKWNGHVLRREDEYVGKRVMAMEVPGKRGGRPKRRWLDNIKNDLSQRELSGEAQDRVQWRCHIRNIDPT